MCYSSDESYKAPEPVEPEPVQVVDNLVVKPLDEVPVIPASTFAAVPPLCLDKTCPICYPRTASAPEPESTVGIGTVKMAFPAKPTPSNYGEQLDAAEEEPACPDVPEDENISEAARADLDAALESSIDRFLAMLGGFGGDRQSNPQQRQQVPQELDPTVESPDCGDPSCRFHNEPAVARVVFANAVGSDVLDELEERRLAGTITEGYGFVPGIGTEETVTVELGGITTARFKPFVLSLLRKLGEDSAYVTVNGKDAALLYADGRVEPIR